MTDRRLSRGIIPASVLMLLIAVAMPSPLAASKLGFFRSLLIGY
jgi:hypothetical protein